MKPKIILHQFPHSHYCIRIRFALKHKGLDFDVLNYTNTTIGAVEKLTKSWRLVPILQWNDEIATDSPKIARFLEEKSPTPTLYPGASTPALCDMVNGWCDVKVMLTAAKFLVGEFMEYLGNDADRAYYEKRFESIHGMKVADVRAQKERWGKDLPDHWNLLETALKDHKYLFADTPSYADFGVASRFRLMEFVAGYRVPQDFPRIRDWYQSIRALSD